MAALQNAHTADYLDLTSALKAAQELGCQVELPSLLDKLIEVMIQHAGAQKGYLLLPEGEEWRVVASARVDAAGLRLCTITPDDANLPMDIVRQVARTCEPVFLEHPTGVQALVSTPSPAGEPGRSILCLPLLRQDQLAGIVYLENPCVSDTGPGRRLELLELLAAQGAICLHNARLIAGLKQMEETARANEQRFQHLFENAPLCIFEVDLRPTPPVILAANRRAQAVYGWTAQEFASLSPEQMVPPEAYGETERLAERVRAGETAVLETINMRRDGNIFPVRIIATPEMGTHVHHMMLAVEDITSERLRRSEAEAIDEERRRIAQEIHDGVAQDLATLRLRVSLWYDWLEQDPAKMIAELDEFQSILDREILDMRRAIFGLRPVALEEVGLVPALRRLVEDFENQYQAYVTLNVSGPEQRLPLVLELPLFRVVQEALRNVGKHARASLVWIELDLTQAEVVRLTVRDNGLGFDPASLPGVVRDGHLGLKQMGERVEAVGGRLVMESVPGQGTQMRVELPLG